MTFDPDSTAARGLARCHSCGRVEAVNAEHCPRCHAPLHLRKHDSLQRTIALTLGAMMLYLPADLLPVLRVESTLKGTRQSTNSAVSFSSGRKVITPLRSSFSSRA